MNLQKEILANNSFYKVIKYPLKIFIFFLTIYIYIYILIEKNLGDKKMVYSKVIVGKYVKMRSVEESDAEETLKMRLNKEKTKFLHQVENNLDKQRNWIKNQRTREGDYHFVVEDLKTGKLIGMVGISEIENKRGHIGRILMYGNSFQSFETYYLALKFGFEVLNLEVQWGDTDIENKSAYNLCLTFGMQYKEPVYEADLNRYAAYFDYTAEDFKVNAPKIEKLIYRNRK